MTGVHLTLDYWHPAIWELSVIRLLAPSHVVLALSSVVWLLTPAHIVLDWGPIVWLLAPTHVIMDRRPIVRLSACYRRLTDGNGVGGLSSSDRNRSRGNTIWGLSTCDGGLGDRNRVRLAAGNGKLVHRCRFWLFLRSTAYNPIRSKLTPFSIRFGGTELEVHAIACANGTMFTVKHVVSGTSGLHDRDTILARLVIDSTWRALRSLLRSALIPIKLKPLGALGIDRR